MPIRHRSAYAILSLLVSTSCGSRSSLSWLSMQDDPGFAGGTGGTWIPGEQAGASAAGGTGSLDGGASSGGKPAVGGSGSGGATVIGGAGGGPSAGGSGAPHAGTSGGGGTPPVLDDPTTLGDDRAGFVRCSGKSTAPVICEAPQECCLFQGCVLNASKCQASTLSNCDGKEDCPASQLCCLTNGGFQCQSKCATRTIRHLACNGPCADIDDDLVPDAVDACKFTEFEDGKGPLPEDGCSDYDADGVHDGSDHCPTQMEDGLPPNPDDGCP